VVIGTTTKLPQSGFLDSGDGAPPVFSFSIRGAGLLPLLLALSEGHAASSPRALAGFDSSTNTAAGMNQHDMRAVRTD
jgi:hypothetical protein